MGNIKFEKLTSASVKTSNVVDEGRVYNIDARVNIKENNILKSIEDGYVRKDGVVLCTFNKYGSDNLNANFQNVRDVMVMCGMLQEINGFIVEVQTKLEEGNSVVLAE